MFYTAKTPKWVKKLFSHMVWEMPGDRNVIYLTFDDGPHPQITPFVLDELRKYNARATFFCIGKNVVANPEIFQQILHDGHAVGNHTYDHLDGWKTENTRYFENIAAAGRYIDSDLFRPPYGRITPRQQKKLSRLQNPYKVIMWSVLSGDFDRDISPEQCCSNVIKHGKSGAVVVFHDSEKAKEKMCYALPRVLAYFAERGYVFEKIPFYRREM